MGGRLGEEVLGEVWVGVGKGGFKIFTLVSRSVWEELGLSSVG